MEILRFYAHPTRGPLFEFLALGRCKNREHRLGCAAEILSEILATANEGMKEDPDLWRLMTWFSNDENMSY